ncbi:hypothetical protein CDL15_Pgr003307 [Punica granatum]|uniref:Uncharacterized protein n=1 Tax=Punica granatum TaxID=22663 RepID=A0A218X340_PUNGR|nr:hypothetical protein CDL15_Pgr003307 [Punica granatum]
MHDQLRDLGRAIVEQENYKEPRLHSILWHSTVAMRVLEGQPQEGMTKVEAISLEGYQFRLGHHCFKDDQFKNIPNLRILMLDKASLSGNFERMLPNLRWLSWHFCNISPTLPTNLNLKNLVVLDLSRSMVSEDWAGWSLMKELPILRGTDKLGNLEALFCNPSSLVSALSPDIPRTGGAGRSRDSEYFSLQWRNLADIHMEGCGNPTEIEGVEELTSLRILNRELPIQSSKIAVAVGPSISTDRKPRKATVLIEIRRPQPIMISPDYARNTSHETRWGMTKVEAISLEGYQFRSENLCFKDDQFKNPPILRILLLDKASLSGNFEGILPNLRGLSWHLCNISPMLPTNLNLKNLIVLDLSRSMAIEDWAGWRLMKVAAKLKVLDLTECAHLTGTPGFSAFPALEETDSSILSQLGLG